jgi:hypothetical protein
MTTDAYLTGPIPAVCGQTVPFGLTLTKAMDVDVTFAISSSDPADGFFGATEITIPKGTTSWGFSMQVTTLGTRTVTIACDNPDVTIKINHVTYTPLINCPSDSGSTDQVKTFANTIRDCANHRFTFQATPTTVAELDLYGDSTVSILITE